MAFPVPGASILLLNRYTGKQSQCSGKRAASEQSEENITRASGGPTRGRPRKEETGMLHVFVVDEAQRPLAPVHPGRARLLLKAGTPPVFKRNPSSHSPE